MAEYTFFINKTAKKWVISAPKRSLRTNVTKQAAICPFCLGSEQDQEETYRVGGKKGDSDWQILVLKNKYPFTPNHEVIIHSPDHHKNIDELPFDQLVLLLQTYRQRVLYYTQSGYVYIFHNRGHAGGESIPHPHSQLTVIPQKLAAEIPTIQNTYWAQGLLERNIRNQRAEFISTDYFEIYCPEDSQWPDEIWIVPKKKSMYFKDITDDQIHDSAFVMARVIQLMDLRHGHEFPFNYYIYPGKHWYVRVIPRLKILGGFELGTGVMVNTQNTRQTMHFLKEHFWKPDYEKIMKESQAEYRTFV